MFKMTVMVLNLKVIEDQERMVGSMNFGVSNKKNVRCSETTCSDEQVMGVRGGECQ